MGNDDTFNDSNISSSASTLERNTLFKLYYQLSKLQISSDRQGCVLSRTIKSSSKMFTRDAGRSSIKKDSMSLPTQSDISVACSNSIFSKNDKRITIEVYDFEFKAFISPGAFEQIEPFIVKGYLEQNF
uniref:Uncharacterized protein n=1 Tax=Strongyloides papillosus TaxID=174720 RepID=A0A0N5CIK3_STREA